MSIINIPSSLSGAIQKGLLYGAFEQSLRSTCMFRTICEKVPFPMRVGETLTRTRVGLQPTATTPLNPTTNTNLDNGLIPDSVNMEQYTMTLNDYGATKDLNIVQSAAMIADLGIQYAIVNGEQAARTLDELARNALYDNYLQGNTFVRVALGSAGTTVAVDDIRGFTTVLNAFGQMVSINADNPLPVYIGSDLYSCVGYSIDATNVSTARRDNGFGIGGRSGTITLSTNVTTTDATLYSPVISGFSPAVLRPSARATTQNLTSGDLLTMSLLLDARAVLKSNAVPTIDGAYHVFADPISLRQLFSDPEFQSLYRGRGLVDPMYANAQVYEGLGMRFFETTQAPQQLQLATTGRKIHRPIVCGADVLVEGTFEGQEEILNDMPDNRNAEIDIVDSVAHVIRGPLDRRQQIVALTWSAMVGYAAPTDATANRTVIPTASNAYLKRAVVLETA